MAHRATRGVVFVGLVLMVGAGAACASILGYDAGEPETDGGIDAQGDVVPVPDAVDSSRSDGSDAPAPSVDSTVLEASTLDVAAEATVYSDPTSASLWAPFSIVPVGGDYEWSGGTFDGQYVYFAPNSNHVVVRYDTKRDFSDAGGDAWSGFATTTVAETAEYYSGAAFDGRFVYLVPNDYGVVARYDTHGNFADPDGGAWSTVDLVPLNASCRGFAGSAFDGRYIYLVPNVNRVAARYDTDAGFGDLEGGAWTTLDTQGLLEPPGAFLGAVFDGHYVYYVPSTNGIVARFDTTVGTFSQADAGAWKTFNTMELPEPASAFHGGAFDGRYVYFVPGAPTSGIVARYDSQASFTDTMSWTTFDTTSLTPDAPMASGFYGAAFDGRYLYLIPDDDGAYAGRLVRYDTTASFTDSMSWLAFDTATLTGSTPAVGFEGAVFDGQYLYLVPWDEGTVWRFDAKTPPSLPPLPGFTGSFY